MKNNKSIGLLVVALVTITISQIVIAEPNTATGKKNKTKISILQAQLASLEAKYASLASVVTKLQIGSITGTTGPQGEQGPQGPAGEPGPQGESGASLPNHCYLTTIVSKAFGEDESPTLLYYVPDADRDYLLSWAASVYRTKLELGSTVINYNKPEDAEVTEAYLIPSADGTRVDGVRVTMNPSTNGVHKTMLSLDVYVCSMP